MTDPRTCELMSVRAHGGGLVDQPPRSPGPRGTQPERSGATRCSTLTPPASSLLLVAPGLRSSQGKDNGVLSQTLPVQDHNQIPRGPGDDPLTFGVDGKPITLRDALELLEDLERRTLRKTPVTLPSGSPAVVRTVLTVFDDEASRGPVPRDHTPQIYASVLYSQEPENRYMQALWMYGSPEEAKAGHPEAVDEFVSGRTRVTC